MEDWIRNPGKTHTGGSIIWKAVVKSFGIIEAKLAWQIGNGRKLRVGEDPWVVCNQEHILWDGTVRALRLRSIFFLYQLSAPIQEYRWEHTWIEAIDLVLICHNNLGTKHKSHQRLITIRHENGVIVLQNE